MNRKQLIVVLAICASVSGMATGAQAPDDRPALTLMRAINTAENAVRQSSGTYISLAQLIDHPAMGRVKANVAINGHEITHEGRRVRLLLSPNAMQYQAMIVPSDACSTSLFSDESGLIYTAKGLGC